MKRVLLGLLLSLGVCSAPAAAQTSPQAPTYISAFGQKQGSTGVFLQNLDGSAALLGGNTNCLVVSGDQAFTVGSTQQLTCTGGGRVRIGLSSATNITPASAPTNTSASDLVGCVYLSGLTTWTSTWQGALSCNKYGAVIVSAPTGSQITKVFTSATTSSTVFIQKGVATAGIDGTFVASCQVERQMASGTYVAAAAARTTADVFNIEEGGQGANYRWNCPTFTSGTANAEITQ